MFETPVYARDPVALDAEQRLVLQLGEVPDALGAEQVAIEPMPQGLRQAVGGPRRLVRPEGVGERPINQAESPAKSRLISPSRSGP